MPSILGVAEFLSCTIVFRKKAVLRQFEAQAKSCFLQKKIVQPLDSYFC